MARIVGCKDIDIDCKLDWDVRFTTEKETLRKFENHARETHYPTGVPKEIIERFLASIPEKKDEVLDLGLFLIPVISIISLLFTLLVIRAMGLELSYLEIWYLYCILIIPTIWFIFFLTPSHLRTRIPSLMTYLDDHSKLRTGDATSDEYNEKVKTISVPLSVAGATNIFLLLLVQQHLNNTNDLSDFDSILKYFSVFFSFCSIGFTILSLEILDTVANPYRTNDKNVKKFFYRDMGWFFKLGAIGMVYLGYATLSIAGVAAISLVFYNHFSFYAAAATVFILLPYLYGYYRFGVGRVERTKFRTDFKFLAIVYTLIIILIQLQLNNNLVEKQILLIFEKF